MEILDGLKEIEYSGKTKVVIGKFDGIHAGHQKLIRTVTEGNDGLKSVVFTFTFSSEFFKKSDERILTDEERRNKFESLGVDYLVEYELNAVTAAMEPEEFVREILVNRLHCKKIVCGNDLSFGNKGKGNVELILQMKEETGIEVLVIDKLTYKGQEISSTRIRKALKAGEIGDAKNMLG